MAKGVWASFWAGGPSLAAMARLDMETAALPTDDDQEFLTGRQRNSNPWRKGAVASALALGLGAACFAAGRGSVTAMVTNVEQKYNIDVLPPMDECMADSKDCSKSMCCKTSGHICYEKESRLLGPTGRQHFAGPHLAHPWFHARGKAA